MLSRSVVNEITSRFKIFKKSTRATDMCGLALWTQLLPKCWQEFLRFPSSHHGSSQRWPDTRLSFYHDQECLWILYKIDKL